MAPSEMTRSGTDMTTFGPGVRSGVGEIMPSGGRTSGGIGWATGASMKSGGSATGRGRGGAGGGDSPIPSLSYSFRRFCSFTGEDYTGPRGGPAGGRETSRSTSRVANREAMRQEMPARTRKNVNPVKAFVRP